MQNRARQSTDQTGHGGVVVLLLFFLILRLAWAIAQPRDAASIDRLPDQREYLSLGQNLLHHGQLSFVDPRFDQAVYAYRTPGYPQLIAACGGSPIIVRIVQAFIDTSTLLAVYLIARRLSGSSNIAMAALFIAGVNPFLIYFCGLLLSETLFTSLLIWGIYALLRRWVAFAGIIFTAAIMVRPSALILGPLLAMVAEFANPGGTWTYRLNSRLWRALTDVAIVSGIMIIGLVPWAVRNQLRFGSFVFTTTNGGITLYDGFNPDAQGDSDQRFITQMPELRSMNEVERSRYLQQRAMQWIQSHPRRVAELMLKKILRTWSLVPLSAEFGRPLYRAISAAYALPLDLLAILGIFSPRLSRTAKMLLLTPVFYFTLVHALSVGSLRYRVPVEPESAILAGCIAGSLGIRASSVA
jgi:Alg9-like mannosyltransferase family